MYANSGVRSILDKEKRTLNFNHFQYQATLK